MATGFERREQVAQTTRTASREFNPQSQALGSVSGPRLDSGAGMRQHEAEVQLIMGTAVNMAATQQANFEERSRVDGALLYQQGKSEEELAASGANRYTVEGFKLQKLNTEAMKWVQMEDDAILANNMNMSADEYRAYLGDKFGQIVEQAGKDPQAKKIVTALAEEMMPKLLSRQVSAHEQWKEDQTALSYAENLVAVSAMTASTENEISTWMENNITEQMPMRLRNKMLSMALEQSLDNDNTKILKVFNGKGGYGQFQFDEAQREGVENAERRFEGRMEQKQKQNLSDALAQMELDLEQNGNFSAANQTISKLQSIYGDKFGKAVFTDARKNVLRQHKAAMKEEEESNVLVGAMAQNQLYLLPKSEQQKALAILDAQIVAEVDAKVKSGVIPQAQQQAVINTMRINKISEQGVVSERLSRELTGKLGINVLDDSGKVSEDARDAFEQYAMLRRAGGVAFARDHIKDPATLTKLEIAEDVFDATGDAKGALLRAQQLYEDNDKMSVEERRQKFASSVKPEDVNNQLEKLRARITPDIVTSWFGNNAQGAFFNTMREEEVDRAIKDPRLENQIKTAAMKKMMTTPKLPPSTAVKGAYEDVISRGDFVLGSFVVPQKGSIREDMGFESNEYNVADLAMKSYLREFGPKIFTPTDQIAKGRTNPDYNKFQVTSPIDSTRDWVRGVPSIDVQYMSSSKSFLITAYKDKDRIEPLNAVPVMVPAKDVGDYYKKIAEHDKTTEQARRQEVRRTLDNNLRTIKAKYMPDTYGQEQE